MFVTLPTLKVGSYKVVELVAGASTCRVVCISPRAEFVRTIPFAQLAEIGAEFSLSAAEALATWWNLNKARGN